MLTIEIKINGRFIAGAKVSNISQLADISDYHVESVEQGSTVSGMDDLHTKFLVKNHERRQSVWTLVQQIASSTAQAAYRQQSQKRLVDAEKSDIPAWLRRAL